MLQKLIDESRLKVVVLDDDPTGTQTVHGISVYTDCLRKVCVPDFWKIKECFIS